MKCTDCHWLQNRQFESSNHYGCYVDGKWKKWLPFDEIDIPNKCPDWELEEKHG